MTSDLHGTLSEGEVGLSTLALWLNDLNDVPNFLTRPGLFRVGLQILGRAPRQRRLIDERREFS